MSFSPAGAKEAQITEALLAAECDGDEFESITIDGTVFNYGVQDAPAIFDGCTVEANATNTDFTVTLTNSINAEESVNGQAWEAAGG